MFRDLGEVLSEGRYLKRWLVIAAIGQLPVGMVFAFSSVYAHEVKGADAVVLGGMAAAAAVGSIALAIPLGRIADRVGRKRVLYATIPLFSLSCIVLVWAPGPVALLLAGALQSFYYIGGPIAAAMERELVPAAHMGRWIGIARVVKMLRQRDARARRGGHLGPARAGVRVPGVRRDRPRHPASAARVDARDAGHPVRAPAGPARRLSLPHSPAEPLPRSERKAWTAGSRHPASEPGRYSPRVLTWGVVKARRMA